MDSELYDLAKIYLGCLKDSQLKTIFYLLTNAQSSFISGTMPLSEHLFYTYEHLLADEREAITKEKDDRLAVPNFIIVVAKLILKKGDIHKWKPNK